MPDSNIVSIAGAEETPAPKPEPKFVGELYSSETPLPGDFARIIQAVEAGLGMPLWLILQADEGQDEHWCEISENLHSAFASVKGAIEANKPVALLLHSPGGLAEEGYKIMRLFQRRTNKLITVVPRYAKSAATMMALAGRTVVMGEEAELGPLDVQLLDDEETRYESALNAVQSLERLNAYGLTALDQAMALFLQRTRKKPDVLLPIATQYATSMIGPLVSKIDSVALTRKSRTLKVAEDYAIRLMKEAGYTIAEAKRIASVLVERFSYHGFVIDRTEAKSRDPQIGLGLNVTDAPPVVQQQFDLLEPFLRRLTVIGRLKEIQP